MFTTLTCASLHAVCRMVMIRTTSCKQWTPGSEQTLSSSTALICCQDAPLLLSLAVTLHGHWEQTGKQTDTFFFAFGHSERADEGRRRDLFHMPIGSRHCFQTKPSCRASSIQGTLSNKYRTTRTLRVVVGGKTHSNRRNVFQWVFTSMSNDVDLWYKNKMNRCL